MPDSTANMVMRKGSVSFYLASRFLPREVRDSVTLLYQWCRHCDDVIDGQHLGQGRVPTSGIAEGLASLTENAVRQDHGSAGVFSGMGYVVRRHAIPMFYVQELIAGMKMDSDSIRYRTFDDLKTYCFRVAGTVGLMFTHITGASSPHARRHAAELGMAMQLTNIARDVGDDFAIGRVYLPLSWLEQAGVSVSCLMAPSCRAGLRSVVARLLDEADRLYASGDEGLGYLPLRVAFAVAAARQIYAEIGVLVRRAQDQAWDCRQHVTLPRKLVLLGRAAWQVAKTLPVRLRKPWRAAPLAGDWRLS